MFTNKTGQSSEPKLADVVKEVACSGYIFDEINSDLGATADEIMKNSKRVIMAYGYARRAAVAGLYIQGHFKKESYDHVHSIFKALQFKTEHSIEFQEQAFADAISFMQTYNSSITKVFVKTMVKIAQEYEVPSGHLDDDELIEEVLQIADQEAKTFLHYNEYDTPTHMIGDADWFEKEIPIIHAEKNEAERGIPNRISEIISTLHELSSSDSQKSETMWIMPLGKRSLGEFHFSPKESDMALKLTSELYEIMEGKVAMPKFTYRPR